MKIKDIFNEAKQNMKYEDLVLVDEWSDDGDLVTIFKDEKNVVIQVLGFFSQEIKKKEVDYQKFRNMKFNQFKKIINDLTRFSYEQLKIKGYDDMINSFRMIV